MLFQSWTFLVFFIIFYIIYLLVKETRARNLWILVSSYFFYGLWEPWFLILIAYATVFDYVVLGLMEKSGRKRLWLTLSILNNVALLSFFKYAGFVADNINSLFSSAGSSLYLDIPSIILPVGISFYVFKSLGYAVDCYRGEIARERNFITHAAFVSFFPILLAGPIERAKNLLSQLRQTHKVTKQDVADGLSLFIVGLFKKLALADYLKLYVDKIYGNPGQHESAALMLATFAFAWQIYFDFSGYTDMARGVGRMMGFRIMLNFNNPYLATSLADFWRRWHISLSSWFKDYVYIPLGGNRKGTFSTYKNVFLTMVISGLWHGAAWNFIIWGAVHGIGSIATREFERSKYYREYVPKFLKQVFVFVLVTFAWIFFRASTFEDARLIVSRIFTSSLGDPQVPLLAMILVLAVWVYQFIYESRFQKILAPSIVRVSMVAGMVIYMIIFSLGGIQAFIYNQF